VQVHGEVRTLGLATSEAVMCDREEACSTSGVGEDGMSFGDYRDDVSGDVYTKRCVPDFSCMVRS
jgi:hypothetical protein